MVKAHRLLADALGIDRIDLLVGGSLGGQQAIEWAIEEPERFRRLALIATNAQHSPWGIAFNESQRMAIASDPTWKTSTPRAGTEGLKAARAMALLSYRSYHAYHTAQSESDLLLPETFRAASYQHHQGEKLARRFNAYSYNLLSRAMDSHCVGRGKNGNKQALQRITAHTLVVGIASDLLFPVSEQEYLAAHIPDANLVIIDSLYGHDGFLIETAQLSALLKLFLINQSIELSYGH
jgi:homoserine O-acetyltransferase